MQVQRNKAIVGQNAFAHEAGIHQDGMLKDRSTYEIMRPEDVGIPSTDLVLGKHSGRHALKQRIADLGYQLDDAQLLRIFEAFKVLADRKKIIYDADIEALVENQLHSGTSEVWTLENFSCSASFGVPPTAAVTLRHQDGRIVCEPAVGDGPVDAVLKSIQRGTGIDLKVTDYRVRSVTGGLDAQGEAVVEVEFDNRKLSRSRREHECDRSKRPGFSASHQSHRTAASAAKAQADRSCAARSRAGRLVWPRDRLESEPSGVSRRVTTYTRRLTPLGSLVSAARLAIECRSARLFPCSPRLCPLP